MRRRDFIALVGSATALPLAARAQQAARPTVGFLHSASLKGNAFYVTAFRNGLKEAGFTEGENVEVDYRWAEGEIDRLPTLAADLIGRHAAAIAADTRGALTLKKANTTVPVVFSSAGDPVKLGLVPSLNRPGGNMTGVSFLITAAVAKRLELLHQLIPTATEIGYLTILLKKSEYRLSPIFPASWVRFSDSDVGGLIIHPRLNGATSKSTCRGN